LLVGTAATAVENEYRRPQLPHRRLVHHHRTPLAGSNSKSQVLGRHRLGRCRHAGHDKQQERGYENTHAIASLQETLL
jgi:hypothetical protein